MKYNIKLNIKKTALVIVSGLFITNFLLFALTDDNKHRSYSEIESAKEAAKAYIKDSKITLEIYSKYTESPMLSPFDITVQTDVNGYVTLSGALRTEAKRKEAIKLAKSVQGVRSVNADNLLVQASNQPVSDSWITAKVMMVLFKESLSSDISVETKNGIVYLSGKTKKEKANRAVHLIKGIEGVASIEDSLEIV